jgi:hypothetical protein
LLRTLERRDVRDHPERSHDLALLVVKRTAGNQGPEPAAVFAPKLELVLLARRAQSVDESTLGSVPARLLHELDDRPSKQLFGRVTQHLGRALVDEHGSGLDIEEPHTLGGRVDDLPVTCVGASRCALGPIA